MVWFKVSDGLHSHRKTIKAGDAMALWVIAGSWCGDQLTDGFVPAYMIGRLMPGPGDAMAAKLVEVELWDEATKDGEAGYQFHGWDELDGTTKRNPTREDVEEKKRYERERKRDYRRGGDGRYTGRQDRPDNVPRDTQRDTLRDSSGSPTSPTRPDPTLTSNTVTSGDGASVPEDTGELLLPVEAGPDLFDRFWEVYPRKTAKKDARKRWDAAVKAGVRPADIIEAAERYALHSKRERLEARYIAHPATWLNAERWEDLLDIKPEPFNPWGKSRTEDVNPWDVANVDPWAGKE